MNCKNQNLFKYLKIRKKLLQNEMHTISYILKRAQKPTNATIFMPFIVLLKKRRTQRKIKPSACM
jgi:hypothetical protein